MTQIKAPDRAAKQRAKDALDAGLAMPFTVEQFFAVFARYNTAIWPVQILAYGAAALIVVRLLRPSRPSTLIITAVLASMWALNGIGYHWTYFSDVNPVARGFAVIFVAQAVLLLVSPWLFPTLRFAIRPDASSAIGVSLIAFAAVLYPVLGTLAGHAYPSAPVFGVAPCPTTIFTIGVLLAGPWQAVRWLLIIPCIWAIIGGSAAILLNVPQDFGLVASLPLVLALGFGHWRELSYARHEIQL